MLTLTPEDPFHPEAIALIERLWFDLGERYGDTGPCLFKPKDISGEGCVFIVAHWNGVAAGCGALRPLPSAEPGIGEVKRMYVAPEARRHGVARALLHALENLAPTYGYHTLRLETGTAQPEAIALYERTGWHRIAPYGPYANEPRTVCFEKPLPLDDQ